LDLDLMRARTTAVAGALFLVAVANAGCSVSTTSDTTQTSDERPSDLLHDRRAATRALAAVERRVGTTPARATEVLAYPEYLDIKVQDPAVPEHIDEYEWRGGSVSGPEPVHLSGPQEEVEASLFPTSAVRWRDVPDIVREVEARAHHARPTRIEGAIGSYLIVRRSTNPDDDGRVEIDLYLEGPRRSGYAELTANGDLVTLHVS
jgi:hypothetical protein